MLNAYSIKVRGVVQGVGFRPFVYRLARANGLKGWVLNAEEGVKIHLEGDKECVQLFLEEMKTRAPQAAAISEIFAEPAEVSGFTGFIIQESAGERQPTVRISPDLPVCKKCLQELFDPQDRRYHYPYINCTDCGPRYSVIQRLPYDRPNTTMADWLLDGHCAGEYGDPANRRFHAQPVACPACGPHYAFRAGDEFVRGDKAAIQKAVHYLQSGMILAVKGLGGYHLACDAKNPEALAAVRARKYRKEKPFALMAKNIEVARSMVHLCPEAEMLINSVARPIVLAPAKTDLPGVAPENDELGVMLPYTPLHYLLFAAGAPEILVMTSANRSSEPIAYQDDDALRQLSGIADGFLIGERPIARRVEDSVARVSVFGPTILRRARGYAPGAAATFPTDRPILALGADLKNTITLVVDGQAFVSQHIGDLDHYESFCSFQETIRDLLSMYEIDSNELLLVHDLHPQYISTMHASDLSASKKCAVQHHRAHVASVIAERGAWDKRVVGVSFDGTGYGDDGTIWGGEIFAGSLREGFNRVAHLRAAALPGGDAAAACPIQAAAGFLAQLNDLPDLSVPPFSFPSRYRDASQLVRTNIRCFPTSSMGRLFDTAAALMGFTREITFEGQAAMWLERLARHASTTDAYPFPFTDGELDFRPLLAGMICDRLCGRVSSEIARAFQRGIAQGLHDGVATLCHEQGADTVVLSGGVFQNELLLSDIKSLIEVEGLQVWTNHVVPPGDGGISLGQAAVGAMASPGLGASLIDINCARMTHAMKEYLPIGAKARPANA
ncbi:MAG: (NiFe) hydrogenase maturation protein HypF [Candidatus Acidoferrum typicum]|nr:(NiFe) hydrogenase maturation protein HypF [Candidatus Acidoferrum typicum]